ncbi:hypothetical protein [Pontibacillus salipaludis]|uniref:DUF4901 domain-containing protein n=1 Tax=Pontibacillus salipaludis TaxID=1697394 RepID=A0ABQ1Q0Q9_9BACI|nr:hypothetical protein [Pontibacillus salipaludis]GGD08514.1 hypothetical protein GCM10011389_15160 [Pontibacillus salipaludis]
MKQKLEAIEERMKRKFGLEDYTLERTHLHREVEAFEQTHYVYNMEWFPEGSGPVEDDLNPEGTASIDVDVHTGEVRSLIFVSGVSKAKTPTLPNEQDVIHWVEQETGLTQGEHFFLKSKQDRTYMFYSAVNGIPTTPSGIISVEVNDEDELVFFTIHGYFPEVHDVQDESFSLSLEDIADLIKNQLMLVNFPIMETKRFESVYALEEIYIKNDGKETRPFHLTDSVHLVPIGEIMTYEPRLDETFQEEKIDLTDEVTVEQAEMHESHPDLTPITEEMVKETRSSLQRFLQVVYPTDSGEWLWQSVERENGYVLAKLENAKRTSDFYKRKVNVFLNQNSTSVLTYIENDFFSEMTADFEQAEEVTLTKHEALILLEDKITLTPVYVWDPANKRYTLHGKLDCSYVVDAHSGEVKVLSEIE